MIRHTDYAGLLNAVGDYYGTGSDEWNAIAGSARIPASNFTEILENTPNVDVVVNKADDVISYTVHNSYGTAGESVASAINSNAQSATMAGASTYNIPANNTVSQGVAGASSGCTGAGGASVATVAKNVAIGIGAVSAGIRLGATIDSLLYNANPDFWDEHNMSMLNPETWDSIAGTNKAGQTVLNFMFGINKSTGETQAYMDERALAYIAQYLAVNGAFSDIVPHEQLDPSLLPSTDVLFYPDNDYSQYGVFDGPIDLVAYLGEPYVGLKSFAKGFVSQQGEEHDYNLQVSAFSETNENLFTGAADRPAYNPEPVTRNDITYYVYCKWGAMSPTIGGYQSLVPTYPYYNYPYAIGDQRFMWDIAYLYNHGASEHVGGVEGIGKQTGATLPTGITPSMTQAQVLAYLHSLYPNMVTDAITNDVIQPDGTVKTYTYVPVGFPDGVTQDEVTGALKPVGGVGLTQANPTINPENTPDSTIDTFMELLNSLNPYQPTDTPPDPPPYPDTGDGSTPAVIIPTGSASALWSVYNPSLGEINSFGAWLWSSNFIDQLLKLFNDPMQAIIGLHKIFAIPAVSGRGNIVVGYLDSGVSTNLVSNQYSEVDCGSISLREYFGNALDYTDTDIYLYLPFVGIVPLSTVDVTRASINVKYKVDVFTGACLATVNVNRDNAGGQLYTYAGNCAVQYPISSGSYMGIVSSILGIAGGVVGTIASGGAMLPLALGAGASALNSAHTRVEHSGSLSGNAGAMGIKKPYLIIRRPQTKIAGSFKTFNGQSNNIFDVLGNCAGYTRVKYVNLENVPATGEELTEIENLLKTGVII